MRSERLENEPWLIRFVVFLRQKHGAYRQGIRQLTLSLVFKTPCKVVRLWTALQGLRRCRGGVALGAQDPAGFTPTCKALWSAKCLGWFFMLRASQHLPPQDLLGAPPRVLRGHDLEFFKEGGVRCTLREAAAVFLQFFNFGKPRTTSLPVVKFVRAILRGVLYAVCPILSFSRRNPHWLNDPSFPVLASKEKGVTPEDVSALLSALASLTSPPATPGTPPKVYTVV